MPDGITPVAAQVRVPDPMQGINTYSGILGLKQQQQALQTGQYEQQTAAATADQASQKNAELQAVSNLVKNSHSSGRYLKSDGTFDQVKFANDISSVAPVYGGDVSNRAVSLANEMVTNQQVVQNLNDSQRKQVSEGLQALASKPDVTNSDVIDWADRQLETNKDPSFRRLVLSNLTHIPANAGSQQLQGLLGQFSSQLSGASPQTPSTVDTGSTIQPGATNRFTGAFTPAGQGIKKDLSPTEQLPYVRARGAAGTEGAQGAANDEALYNDIVQKGTKATQLKALTQDIRALSSEVQTGQYSKSMADKWSALKQTFGFRPDDDSFETKRQILSKMAAQLRTQSESGASTDAERSGIEAALPDPEHMGPAAVNQAARYVGALADTQAARARLANQHRQVNGGKSTGIREADSAFMQNADPRVFEYQSIPAGQERQNYLKQHFKSKEEVKAFLDKQQALRSYGAIE